MLTSHGHNHFKMDYGFSSKVTQVGLRLSRRAESAPPVPARGSIEVNATALLAQREVDLSTMIVNCATGPKNSQIKE